MKKVLIFLLSLNLFSYTLDFPGDTPPLDANPNWTDPTKPIDLYNTNEINISQKLNELDEKKLRKLKKALDILFEEEEQEIKEVKEIIPPIKKQDPSEYIQITINGEKPTKKPKNTYKNNDILINIK